jgi:molybdenum cofactor biosynthesis enzyme
MTKAVQRDVVVTELRLEEKLGGRSGHWRRDGDAGKGGIEA